LVKIPPLKITLQAIAVIQRKSIFGSRDPAEEMADLGFGKVELVSIRNVDLMGKEEFGGGFMCLVRLCNAAYVTMYCVVMYGP
jgi:hypothetical protein